MDEFELEVNSVRKWYIVFLIPLIFAALLLITVFLSADFKSLIEIGIFNFVGNLFMRRLVFCAFELLLLFAFWFVIYKICEFCYSRSRSVAAYYISAVAAFAAYAAVYRYCFLRMDAEYFPWLFRMTYNLCAIRFRTNLPEELMPYIIAYFSVTALVMLFSPLIAKRRADSRQNDDSFFGMPEYDEKAEERYAEYYERKLERDRLNQVKMQKKYQKIREKEERKADLRWEKQMKRAEKKNRRQ